MNQQQEKNRKLLLTLNFQDGTLMLNEEILDALGRPGQVQILLNKEAKRLLIRRCKVNSRQAVFMPAEHVVMVEIGGRSLLKKIRKLAGWETEQPRICPGECIPDYDAVCFDLSTAFTVNPGSAKKDASLNQTM